MANSPEKYLGNRDAFSLTDSEYKQLYETEKMKVVDRHHRRMLPLLGELAQIENLKHYCFGEKYTHDVRLKEASIKAALAPDQARYEKLKGILQAERDAEAKVSAAEFQKRNPGLKL